MPAIAFSNVITLWALCCFICWQLIQHRSKNKVLPTFECTAGIVPMHLQYISIISTNMCIRCVGQGEPISTLVLPVHEGPTDDSQTYILFYGNSPPPPLKCLSLWFGKIQELHELASKPILEYLQSMHKSTIKFQGFSSAPI